MKRITVVMLTFFMMIHSVYGLADNGSSAILIDYKSGEILFEKEAYVKRYPASTTKIMTLILIYEEINKGNLKLDDQIVTSSYASSMGGSQIYLKEGESICVDELLKSIIIGSANDACVALGEYISGTISEFVKLMNKKANELKLKNTNFTNCTGLHDENHYTCAYDLGVMAKYLLDIGNENLLKYTVLKEDYIRNNEFWLVNTNKLLSKDTMITGLKTGYTKEAKYCLVATATKNNQTMISVILGEPKANVRNDESYELLKYGFSQYKQEVLFEKNNAIESVYLPLTKEKNIDLYCKEDIVISMKKDQNVSKEYKIEIIKNSDFKKDEHIANITTNNQIFPLYASSAGTSLTFFEKVYEMFLKLI